MLSEKSISETWNHRQNRKRIKTKKKRRKVFLISSQRERCLRAQPEQSFPDCRVSGRFLPLPFSLRYCASDRFLPDTPHAMEDVCYVVCGRDCMASKVPQHLRAPPSSSEFRFSPSGEEEKVKGSRNNKTIKSGESWNKKSTKFVFFQKRDFLRKVLRSTKFINDW